MSSKVELQSVEFELTLQNKDYLKKVVTQICKDFNDEGFENKISKIEGLNLEQVYNLIGDHMHYLMKQSGANFFQKLYQIDMPESSIKGVEEGLGFSMLGLAKQIVKRELLKVLLREQYH